MTWDTMENTERWKDREDRRDAQKYLKKRGSLTVLVAVLLAFAVPEGAWSVISMYAYRFFETLPQLSAG